MLEFLHRNLAFFNAALSASSSIPLAIWINLLTSNDRPKWVWGNAWLDFIFPLLTIVLLVAQYYAIQRLGGLTRETAEGIRGVLKFGVEILAARAGVDDRQVRGHCHRCENGKLIPIAYFTRGFQRDSSLEIPVSDGWFVISRAFTNDSIYCNNSDWSKPSTLSKEIWRDVRGVIACPIKPLPDSANPSSNKILPIGIISFDASRTCEQMMWTRRKGGRTEIDPVIHEAMTELAAVAYIFMKRDLGNE
jgi:hypothetical protein